MSIPDEQDMAAMIILAGGAIDPKRLIDSLNVDHSMGEVIEGIQRGLERGRITLNGDGMVTWTKLRPIATLDPNNGSDA